MIPFFKYHGLGNDYLVIEAEHIPNTTPTIISRICDRNYGIGADGILLWSRSTGTQLRIINPDGSEAEKSGNGLRIFARHLYEQGVVGDTPFQAFTASGTVVCHVMNNGTQVSVNMGHASFSSTDIPVIGPPREVLNEALTVKGNIVKFSAVTIGNPHCVILRDIASKAEAQSLGPTVEHDTRFPNRTNVQFVQVLDRENLQLEIWERGAGYTLASGSSSCAAAAAMHRLGLTDQRVTVHMPGGTLDIYINENFEIQMTGPVIKIAEGNIDNDCVRDAI